MALSGTQHTDTDIHIYILTLGDMNTRTPPDPWWHRYTCIHICTYTHSDPGWNSPPQTLTLNDRYTHWCYMIRRNTYSYPQWYTHLLWPLKLCTFGYACWLISRWQSILAESKRLTTTIPGPKILQAQETQGSSIWHWYFQLDPVTQLLHIWSVLLLKHELR